jgi:hypothetical protein
MFIGKKPEVSHLKIFGCPVFIHIPKEKRNKLEPSGKKGIFVGYCEVSKAFKIYILGHHHIEISRDVTFDEEATLKKSRRCQLEEVYEEEPVNPRIAESVREVPRAAEPGREVVTSPDEETPEDHDITKVQEPPQITFSHKRKLACLDKRSYLRWREVWCTRRNLETSEKTKSILQLHGFDV